MSFILRIGLFAQRGKRLNSSEQRWALIAESLKSDPQLSNREHERRTGTHKNTVSAVRDELEESGQIAHFDKRVDPRTGNASQPVSRPAPQPESAPGITSEEVDELNQLPTEQPTMEQPQPTPGGPSRLLNLWGNVRIGRERQGSRCEISF